MRAAAIALLSLAACNGSKPQAWAGQITSRSQLIGGPRALGDLGDYRVSNDRVRFIIQDIKGPSRAFSTQGGSLIDADLARSDERLDPRTQQGGQDGLGELFPAFFLGSIKPATIAVINDGTNGGTARIRITGGSADFLTQAKLVDATLLGDGLQYSVDYSLGPDEDALVMTAALINPGTYDPAATCDPNGAACTNGNSCICPEGSSVSCSCQHFFPTDVAPLPIGFVGLFGDGQPIFMPGAAGYDVRYQLAKTYPRSYALPTMPGLTTELVAVDGPAVSYGLTFCTSCSSPLVNGLEGVTGFAWHHRLVYGQYEPVSTESMLLPFISGSLFGVFAGEPPQYLPQGKAYTVSMKLRVGLPGPATQLDAFYGERGDDIGTFAGVVREERSLQPMADATVVVFGGADPSGPAATAARSDAGGRFHALLPPGHYTAIARLAPHHNSAPVQFEIKLNQETYLEPLLPRTALLLVEISDKDTGRLIPAKVTLDSTYDVSHSNEDPKTFLYDLRLGDPYRPTDLIFDTADPETRRTIEGVYRAVNGRLQAEVRTGSYRATISRGPAYSIVTQEIQLVAGEAVRIGAQLKRLLPAHGRVAADLHVHAQGSVDSAVSYEDRVASYAVEGIDFIALTEHNYLYDLTPTVQAMGLGDFLQTTVGTEVSSLESGHWNAYPLSYQSTPAAHGQVAWYQKDPGKLFSDLRSAGKYGIKDTIVQVNHPRDSSLGYFAEYGMTGEALTGDPTHDWPGQTGLFAPSGPGFEPGAFSLDFDAMELLTGKRFELVRTFRVPDPAPPPPVPKPCSDFPVPKPCIGDPGSIVRNGTGSIRYPGVLEDWEHLLDSGRRYTAVGNSDSHSTLDGEGGYPRNLIDLGHDVITAREIDDLEVVRAIKGGKVVVTNGPEITLTAIDFNHRGPDGKPAEVPVGGLITPDSTGTVQVHVVIDAAPWMDLTQANLIVSRGPCDETLGDCRLVPLTLPGNSLQNGKVRRLDTVVTVSTVPGQDGWIAAMATGDRSMWPVVIPLEIPPLLIADAVNTLEKSFGFKDAFGNLKPTVAAPVKPWALTNPILIDGNADGVFGTTAPPRPRRAEAPGPERGQGDDALRLDLAARLAAWK